MHRSYCEKLRLRLGLYWLHSNMHQWIVMTQSTLTHLYVKRFCAQFKQFTVGPVPLSIDQFHQTIEINFKF